MGKAYKHTKTSVIEISSVSGNEKSQGKKEGEFEMGEDGNSTRKIKAGEDKGKKRRKSREERSSELCPKHNQGGTSMGYKTGTGVRSVEKKLNGSKG